MNTSLLSRLEYVKDKIVRVAQEEIDNWDEEELGGGGICDQVANAISGVLSYHGIHCLDGGQEGDDHAFLIAFDETEAYIVDIPAGCYEIGGGYNWRKIPGAIITTDDVYFETFERDLIADRDEVTQAMSADDMAHQIIDKILAEREANAS